MILNVNNPKSSAISRGKRLKSLRKMADLSRHQIDQKYDISENTQRSWEEGKHTGLTEQGARRILMALRNEGLRCSIGWLLHGTGSTPQLSEKLISSESALLEDPKSESPLSSDNANIQAELALFHQLNENAVSMIVQDDGMEPLFMSGDTIAGIRRFGNEISKLLGRNCIVETEMGEKYARQIRRGSKSSRYTLMCINSQTVLQHPTLYDIELVSAAPVIWHRIKDAK